MPVASDDAVNDRKVSGNGNSGQMSVNGQRESANSFLVNGGDVEESVNNGASIVPDARFDPGIPTDDELL